MDGTLQTSPVDAAARRLRPVLISAAVLLAILLAFFAWSLVRSQNQQRDDLEQRFDDRAQVAGAVNEAIFAIAQQGTQARDSEAFGGAEVDPARLRARVEQTNQIYAQIVDAKGNILAESVGAPERPPSEVEHFRKALKSGRTEYSSLLEGPRNASIFESATPFKAADGSTRVDLSGAPGEVLTQFLNGFLQKLPAVSDARSYVIDGAERLIAAPGERIRPGTRLADAELAEAVAKEATGSYGEGRYFTSAPIAGTPWKIVLSADKADLYEPVDTTVPWIIFATLGIAGLAGLWLLQRVLRASTELARAELSRRHALEINDNVVQRLVIAKYALDRGATETSQQKLAETLRETQQLVTSLLEQKAIEPGSLRRVDPAATEGPPPPPEARSL